MTVAESTAENTGADSAAAGRVRRVVAAVAGAAARLPAQLPRPLGWLLTPRRLLVLAWLVALITVGLARSAAASPVMVGPDLAHGAPKTLFEQYDFLDYKLTVKPDDENSGWFDLGAAVLQVIGFINNLILWACLGLLYGGLTLLQWFLNLTIYRDSAQQIDSATQMIAGHVFWPLIGATAAVGAFLAYARWRAEGRGFLSDLGWVVAAATIAIGFASGPSQIMTQVDGMRQDMASGIVAGSTAYTSTTNNPTGYQEPTIVGDPAAAATRKLVEGVWNTFGSTTWCYAEFHDLDICRVAGSHALADDDQWKSWMQTLDNQGSVPEFKQYGDWIRGQDMTRTGYLLLMALITIPLALLLLRLVISGLISVVGFLLMLVIGLLFLVFWPIPGWFRQLGTRYWLYTLGLELQSLFITVVVSGVMVVSTIISTQMGRYGYFIVALLNVALFFAAVKARSWLEMLTTVGGAGAMGVGSALIMRSVARSVVSAGAGMLSGGLGLAAGAAAGAAKAAGAAGRGPSWGQQPGARSAMMGMRRVSTPGRGGGGMSSLNQGPIQASGTRLAPPGRGLGRTGTAGALPAGTGAGQSSGAGQNASGVGVAGGSGAGGPTSRPNSRPTSRPGSGPKRATPMAAQHGGHPGAARSTTEDAELARNVRRANRSGRVFVDRKGEGLSSLDNTPPPPRARQGRSGAYRITTLPRRGGRTRGGGDQS